MIVTGCQRSGTKTASHIFGLDHEIQFNPHTTFQSVCDILSSNKLRAESSWLAMPYLSLFAEYDIPVINLIRHPINVIASLMGIKFWDNHQLYRDYIYKHLPMIQRFTDPLLKSIFYYIYWNKPLLEYPRIQIEAIQRAPKLNKRKKIKLKLSDIPHSKLKDELLRTMREYNYA